MQCNIAGRCALKHLFGPSSVALESVGECAVSFSDEVREVSVRVGENLVDVGRENLNCVKDDPKLSCEYCGRVPIDLL